MKKNLLLIVLLTGYFKIANAQVLDPSFGAGGIVKTDMGATINSNIKGKQVLVQPDGSIYIIVEAQAGTLIYKKRPDGSTDSSYGNNGLSAPLPINGSHGALEPDGKIVIAGSVANSSGFSSNQFDFAVARINTDGSVDGTFGNGVNIKDNGSNEIFNAITIQADGKIICAGETSGFGQSGQLVVIRYNGNGSVDNTFSEDRTLVNEQAGAYSIGLQPDEKIIVGGFIKGDLSALPAVFRFTADGSLDSSFNGSGIKSMDPTGGVFGSLVVQNDNKIIAGSGITILRLNETGSVDSTYGTNGIQTFNFGGTSQLNSIALQNNGKLVVGGYTLNGSNYDFAVARYDSSGAPDSTFNGNGKLTTDFGSSNEYANSIAIQNDGKVVAAGYLINNANNNFAAVARYNTDGSLDNSLNGSGLQTYIIRQGDTHYTCTALQTDGKLIAAGYTWTGSKYEFALARYNINGTLDNTFSDDGEQFKTFDSSSTDKVVAIAIQPDGKIVVTGSAGDSIIIARYNTNGNPDGTFNVNGFVIMNSGLPDYVTSIALQDDGKILIGGKTAVLRFNSDGTLDTNFGINGKLSTPFNYYGSAFNCNAITLQKDGKIVIVASEQYSNTGALIFGRYNNNGTTDSTFGTNGETEVFNFNITGKSVGIQSDGKIVAGGYQKGALLRLTTSTFAVVRVNTDGTLDNIFGDNGMVFTSIGSLNYGTSLLIQSDNKIILGGYSYNGSNNDFTIARYNTNGSLDNTFGTQGILVTTASWLDDGINGMAMADNNLYAAGYGQYPGNLGVVTKYLLTSLGALPVTLFNFSAQLQNSTVLLRWETASEQNLSNFIVERSANGFNFLPIGNVMANDNSTTKTSYSTLDEQPLTGNNFYRLKMIDFDGKYSYSPVVSVNIASQFTLKISPNPANNILLIQANGDNEAATLQIEDMMGRKLKHIKVVLNGNTSFSIDISNLPKGIYNLTLLKNKKTETQKFVKE